MTDSNEQKKGGFGAFEKKYKERWEAARHPESHKDEADSAAPAPAKPPASDKPTDPDPEAAR